MIRTTQQKFFASLEAKIPKGYELAVDHSFANTGSLRIVPEGRFSPIVVGLRFQFQDDYASFERLENSPAINPQRDDGSFPYVKFDEIESRVLAAIEQQLSTVEVPSEA